MSEPASSAAKKKPQYCVRLGTHYNTPMKTQQDRKAERFAGTVLCPDDAARLVANICEITQQKLPDLSCSAIELTRIFDMGVEVYEESICSEPFAVAIEKFLEQKKDLRPASYREYKSVLRRMLRDSPEYTHRNVRSIRAKDCLAIISKGNPSAHTFDKARRLLHCFFAYALQHNWCSENPVNRLQVKKKKELTVPVLRLAEINRLLDSVAKPEHRECAAAVGLMLWGGLRPTEVTRLRWVDVDLEDMVVRVLPRVSKTGGARLVTIQPILLRWLNRLCPLEARSGLVAPRNWVRRWQFLRRDAELIPWRADALRHTFASYHLRHFADIQQLQLEMGHSTAHLLFSRYLNLGFISKADAAAFWGLRRKQKPTQKPSP